MNPGRSITYVSELIARLRHELAVTRHIRGAAAANQTLQQTALIMRIVSNRDQALDRLASRGLFENLCFGA